MFGNSLLKPPPAFTERVAGTVLFTAFLVVGLSLAVQGLFQTRASLASTFDREADMQRAQINLQELLRLQIDEENYLRGFILTRDPFYVQQYGSAVRAWAAKEDDVRRALLAEHMQGAVNLLGQYDVIQSDWRERIAIPLFARPTTNLVDVEKSNKRYIDYEARTAAGVETAIAQTSASLLRSTQDQINRSSYGRAIWLLVFGLIAIFLNAYGSRTARQLQEERTITDVLQQAFFSRLVPLPKCEVGARYVSASSRLRVGGDLYDVFPLSETHALVTIADVSGKGVDAAVLTAFVRFTVRSIALRQHDPAAVLTEFNDSFRRMVDNPSLFITMLVAVMDCAAGSFTYASAGHDSAYVRRGNRVEPLAVTGPLLGVMDATYRAESIALNAGDDIVLATDGLTEARGRSGELLGDAGAMAWIAQGPRGAQALADDLAERVRKRSGNRPADDLALLIVRYVGGTCDA